MPVNQRNLTCKICNKQKAYRYRCGGNAEGGLYICVSCIANAIGVPYYVAATEFAIRKAAMPLKELAQAGGAPKAPEYNEILTDGKLKVDGEVIND